MSAKRYFVIELVLVCTLMALCVSIYKKRTDAVESNSKSNTSKKVCYLTFDDGPSHNSEKILDILGEYDAKATFFLIGEEIKEEKRPVIERIIEEGHAIGLHSNVHDFNKLYVSVDICVQDFEAEYMKLKEDYGIDTRIFRFPGGSACTYMNGQRKEFILAMQEEGYRCYDWNVSGEDSYGNPTVWSIQKNVFDTFFDYEKPIVLLHDANNADVTVDALPGILERMKAEGYSFETLENEKEYVYR